MSQHIPWDSYFDSLCHVHKEYGTIRFEYNKSFTWDGLNLGLWLRRQRSRYSQGKLRPDQIAKLETLGFEWNGNVIRSEKRVDDWNRTFKIAESYFVQHGNLRIPRNFIKDGVDIGSWLSNLRSAYNGKSKRRLSEYQISQLETIGIEWNYDYKEDLWNRMYQCARSYYEEHGDLCIPQGGVFQGLNLGSWIHEQTQSRKKGRLSDDRISKLNALDIHWNPQKDKWSNYYKCAKKYYLEIGNLDVPDGFVMDNLPLGRWIGVQRQSYNGRKDTLLSTEQIKALESIGMLWHGNTSSQSSFREQLICYYLKQQFPDTISRYKDLGFELDIYIPSINIAVEFDGYYWHKDSIDRDMEKDHLCHQNGIRLIRLRECGLTKLPNSICYLLANDKDNVFIDTLSVVFAEQFSYNPIIDLNKDSFKIVKDYKVQVNSPWYQAFQEAKSYYNEFGNLFVPPKYISPSGMALGRWIMLQRQCKKGNIARTPLCDEQINLLDSIGMVWDPHELHWENAFHYAQMYYEEFGHLLISQNSSYKGFRLGKWVQGQRLQKKRAKNYSQNRLDRLNTIGMIWEIRNAT